MRPSLKMFVHLENLRAFAKGLEAEQRPETRQMLLRLLAEEKANIPAIVSPAV